MSVSGFMRAIFGNPLPDSQIEHEKLPKWKALPVFSSDALSSVAYATEEILLVLVGVSAAAAIWSFPIALAILALIILVAFSYRQTINYYPNGGGAYQVAKENLGENSSLVAGSALLLDYMLTVAVSISSGVAALRSAFPEIGGWEVAIANALIILMTLANLRGLRESGFIFSIPTYFFIAIMTLLLGAGIWHAGFHPETAVHHPDLFHAAYPTLGLFVVLRAFSSGCTALTGIEAVSNGVPAFRSPSSKNAKTTLLWMVVILSFFFVGVTALAHYYELQPNESETILSQIARMVFGKGILYYLVQGSTAMILVLAANTAFADFPRLASLMARDRFMPRQLANIGDRLVFSNGIALLAIGACFLVVLFGARTHALIPLYSVGVFVSFTLSQFGMVIHHLRDRHKGWRHALIINLTGAITTGIVCIVVASTKFMHGAWMTIVLIPILVLMFKKTKQHYDQAANELAHDSNWSVVENKVSPLVVLPIAGFNQAVLQALQYAKSLSRQVHLVSVDLSPEGTARTQKEFKEKLSWDAGVSLSILPSPFRAVVGPLVDFLDQLEVDNPGQIITVVIPEFVTREWWTNFLHNQTAWFLKAKLRFHPKRVTVSVQYHFKK